MRITFLFFFNILLFASCAFNKADSDSKIDEYSSPKIGLHIDTIIKRGKLIAMVNNIPTSYFIYKGKPMGFQYELLNQFSKDLGVELEIIKVSSIPDALDSLKEHKADILASGLTILGELKIDYDFTDPITQTREVLIQRKPKNHKKLTADKLEKSLLRDVTKLAFQPVHVEEGSAYLERVTNLQNEIGDSILIMTYNGEINIDSIMNMINNNQIKYAVTDEHTAKFFIKYFPNLDIKTPISFNQNIGWATPKNSHSLIDTINHWINRNQKTLVWNVTYNKYFKNIDNITDKIYSNYNLENGQISAYDEIIKKEAKKIGWDWKLIAAQISVESGFKPNKKSWAGAQGLMQIMPQTAKELNPNHSNVFDPHQNIRMGTKYNGILFDYWISTVTDTLQAIKFSLASYNIGKGHVFDAQRLAKKFGKNPLIWDNNVENMIVKLSNEKYYKDRAVRHGYCRGIEAFNYVSRISYLYSNYNNFNTDIK